jgi:hypothetical protein
MIPESPRYLISKDRREEAYRTLVYYHAENDPHSAFAAAEMAQIEHTIRLELQNSQRSWKELFVVPGLRKRIIIGSFLGLFTQWSGNTLLSYYLNDLLKMIGFTDPVFVGKMNVGLNSWNLVNAVIISLLVRRFPRRKMYLTCATSLLFCYIAWTISVQQYTSSRLKEAAHLTIAIIFIYQACYNIGYNALTYSESPHSLLSATKRTDIQLSLSHRAVPLRATRKRNHCLPVLQSRRRIFHDICESDRAKEHSLAMDDHVLRMAGVRNCVYRMYSSLSNPSNNTLTHLQYFMFPETYGRTLEELAFLFEDRALADEATMKVEKQMEWSAEHRWSRGDDCLSWDMDIIVPSNSNARRSDDNKGPTFVARENRSPITATREVREPERIGGHKQAIRGERGGWWED